MEQHEKPGGSTKYSCKLQLPCNAPFEKLEGPVCSSMRLVQQAVCLAACKKVHEMGAGTSLSLKEEHRARDLFYALWDPDLFMKRVNSNGEWSLFCPNEVPGLSDCWGEEFEELYTRYEREVMEQCVARLDVAMFNAILRESDNEIPTDPVSDPVVDSKVLPILAGDLSFGSGAQLKNSIGNWSRWLADMFGMDADNFAKEQTNCEDDDRRGGDVESKSFPLMNSLSDLLMLPKDMLIDRSIRKEVCPSLGLPLIKRILCNFTPDEFCPDPVPGAVLEALNSESWLERRKSEGDSISSFPCSAAPIVYSPPLLADVAEKVADAGGQAELGRNASMVQRRGYTSDDDLDELESPLTSIIDKLPPSPPIANGNGKLKETVRSNGEGVRYQLLREVWSV